MGKYIVQIFGDDGITAVMEDGEYRGDLQDDTTWVVWTKEEGGEIVGTRLEIGVQDALFCHTKFALVAGPRVSFRGPKAALYQARWEEIIQDPKFCQGRREWDQFSLQEPDLDYLTPFVWVHYYGTPVAQIELT